MSLWTSRPSYQPWPLWFNFTSRVQAWSDFLPSSPWRVKAGEVFASSTGAPGRSSTAALGGSCFDYCYGVLWSRANGGGIVCLASGHRHGGTKNRSISSSSNCNSGLQARHVHYSYYSYTWEFVRRRHASCEAGCGYLNYPGMDSCFESRVVFLYY